MRPALGCLPAALPGARDGPDALDHREEAFVRGLFDVEIETEDVGAASRLEAALLAPESFRQGAEAGIGREEIVGEVGSCGGELRHEPTDSARARHKFNL